MANDYDLVIVGGGLVGASMACSLAESNYKIAVIEAFKPNSDQQPSFDERTVALTYSSKLIFNAIKAWPEISAEAYPIKDIEVTNHDSFGFTTLGTEDSHTEALGYVVPTRRIGQVLHEMINKTVNIDLICPATVESINNNPESAVVNIKSGDQERTITCKLVILADGGRSGLLEQLGFKTKVKNYSQVALIGIIGSDSPNRSKAFEHFTADGPLALLPLRQNDYALAWTLPEAEAQALRDCSEESFCKKIQYAFGVRAGKFKTVANRNIYPLSYSVLSKPNAQRSVIIGNAAHIVHPVAGQGFNLGLRDVGFLHEMLTDQNCKDPGTTSLLSRYAASRQRDTKIVGQFTDGLIRTFTSDLFPVKAGRNLGLTAINLLPGIKRGLLKRTMGLNGRQSLLAMSGKHQ